MSNESSASLPVAIPIYSDIEVIDTVPLIEPSESLATKTIYNICTCLLCMILFFVFLFYMFVIL